MRRFKGVGRTLEQEEPIEIDADDFQIKVFCNGFLFLLFIYLFFSSLLFCFFWGGLSELQTIA